MPVQKAVVIGAGSWGTALAKMLSEKGYQITLWAHRQEHVDEIVSQRAGLHFDHPGVRQFDADR